MTKLSSGRHVGDISRRVSFPICWTPGQGKAWLAMPRNNRPGSTFGSCGASGKDDKVGGSRGVDVRTLVLIALTLAVGCQALPADRPFARVAPEAGELSASPG